ncbi:hypothetical protein [Lacrimispora brassicae]
MKGSEIPCICLAAEAGDFVPFPGELSGKICMENDVKYVTMAEAAKGSFA